MNREQVPFNIKNLHTYKPHGDWIGSVCIRVGHSDEAEGAESKSGLTEFDYNSPVAHSVAKILQHFGFLVDVYEREKWGEYIDMIRVMNKRSVEDVERYEADIALHLNCYNGKAHGTECLPHYRSKKGNLLARCLIGPIVANFGTTEHRGGIVPLHPGERAYDLVSRPIDPSCIIEGAYIDNPSDEEKIRKYWLSYDEAIVEGLFTYMKSIGINDPRFDSWSWVPRVDISDKFEVEK